MGERMKRPKEYLLRNNTLISYAFIWGGILSILYLSQTSDQYLQDYTHQGSPLRTIFPIGIFLIFGSSLLIGILLLFISSLYIQLSTNRILSALLSVTIFSLQLACHFFAYLLIVYFFIGIGC